VKNQPGLNASGRYLHLKRDDDQLIGHCCIERPPNNLSREQVHDDREIDCSGQQNRTPFVDQNKLTKLNTREQYSTSHLRVDSEAKNIKKFAYRKGYYYGV